MNKPTFVRIAAALLLGAVSLNAFPVQRTFVASFGNDANFCSITSPCRTFTRALTQTDPNGEVIVLDSAGYGAFTVTQSVSVIAPEGVYAGISVFSGDGITVNHPDFNGTVVLRGLRINGQGGVNGIRIVAGAEVHIEGCIVSNMTGAGLLVEGGNTFSPWVYVSASILRTNSKGIHITGGSNDPFVFVNDTRIQDTRFNEGVRFEAGELTLERVLIDGSTGPGLQVRPADGKLAAARVRDSRFAFNGNGVDAVSFTSGHAQAFVEGSVAVRNPFAGFAARTTSTGSAALVLSHSASSANSTGVLASGSQATVYVTGTLAADNTTGFSQDASAVFNTCGDNRLVKNGLNESGAISSSIACAR